jgi:hydroxyquinol 1,2-dioxygenase
MEATLRNFNETTITDAVLGEMPEVQGRHPWRPAHVHFMISAPGFEPLVRHVFVAGDGYLDSAVVFGVKDSLIREFVRCPRGRAPDGRIMDTDHFHLNYDFGLKQVASSARAA